MGRVGRRRLQRPLDDLGHLLVREPRPSRTRLIRQPVDALLQEAAAPLADRVLVHAEFDCHRLIGQAVCAAQDHAAAIGQRARDPAASSLTSRYDRSLSLRTKAAIGRPMPRAIGPPTGAPRQHIASVAMAYIDHEPYSLVRPWTIIAMTSKR